MKMISGPNVTNILKPTKKKSSAEKMALARKKSLSKLVKQQSGKVESTNKTSVEHDKKSVGKIVKKKLSQKQKKEKRKLLKSIPIKKVPKQKVLDALECVQYVVFSSLEKCVETILRNAALGDGEQPIELN